MPVRRPVVVVISAAAVLAALAAPAGLALAQGDTPAIAAPAGEEVIEVILRAFLPDEHPSRPGWILPLPAVRERTMMPAGAVGTCIGTDDRTFSDRRDAPSRFGGNLSISLDRGSAHARPITGRTIAYDCATGLRTCGMTAGERGFEITGTARTATRIEVSYAAAAADPCVRFAPPTEFSGRVVVDLAAETVTVRGKVDCFPSFEALLVKRDRTVARLYAVDPASAATPACLAGSPPGGSREVASPPVKY